MKKFLKKNLAVIIFIAILLVAGSILGVAIYKVANRVEPEVIIKDNIVLSYAGSAGEVEIVESVESIENIFQKMTASGWMKLNTKINFPWDAPLYTPLWTLLQTGDISSMPSTPLITLPTRKPMSAFADIPTFLWLSSKNSSSLRGEIPSKRSITGAVTKMMIIQFQI